MPFRPDPNDTLRIAGMVYAIAEHPAAPGMPYGQAGQRAMVYQLVDAQGGKHALKVFQARFRDPLVATGAPHLQAYAPIPGLQVCARTVLTPQAHQDLLQTHPDLLYSVLMPWVSGETWQKVLRDRQPLRREECSDLARNLVSLLTRMEQRSLAHCDLAGAHLLVERATGRVALVDVEELYAPELERPTMLPEGSAGYTHPSASPGLWSAVADRFAGAVLLSEILGWCDPRVVHLAAGERFFEPQELQQPCPRFQTLLTVLSERWSVDVADAFARVWQSQRLADCPSFSAWATLLNAFPIVGRVDYTVNLQPKTTDETQAQNAYAPMSDQEQQVHNRIERAEALLAQGEVDRAIEDLAEAYRNAPQITARIYSRALMQRAGAYKKALNFAGALADYDLALKVAPTETLREEVRTIIASTGMTLNASTAPITERQGTSPAPRLSMPPPPVTGAAQPQSGQSLPLNLPMGAVRPQSEQPLNLPIGVVQPQSGQPQAKNRGPLIIGVALALVVLLGGGGLMVWATMAPTPTTLVQVPSATPSATVVDQGPTMTAQALANATTTAAAAGDQGATTTALARANATATAQAAVKATSDAATAQVAKMTATALANEVHAAQATIAAESALRAARQLAGEFPLATSSYAPDIEATLIKRGYQENIIRVLKKDVLRASSTDRVDAVWARDLDYAINGYGYVMGDMTVFRNSLTLLLDGIKPDGVVPEGYFTNGSGYVYGNAWDSMPNMIHATYLYVAKTGDRAFYTKYRDRLQAVGVWITRLDTDGNGLPDHDIFPYGYYNSISNNVMHTYALAKFYGAYNDLAELERFAGYDGLVWEQAATALHTGFHRSFDEGGYWIANLAWPVAWRTEKRDPFQVLETFGVFEALHTGLIAPTDGDHYQKLINVLHNRLSDLISGPAPLRLTLGGYEPEMRRDVVPESEAWKLDAYAPWIVGIAAPAYAAAGFSDDAQRIVQSYMAAATSQSLPRLIAGTNNRYGSGKEGGGGVWEQSAWFMAVYAGHYGLKMTPGALIVQPYPFQKIALDAVRNISYQGTTVQLELDAAKATYVLRSTDKPIVALVRPLNGAAQVQINDGPPSAEQWLVVQPGQTYEVVSIP